jgi:hypothetical protein
MHACIPVLWCAFSNVFVEINHVCMCVWDSMILHILVIKFYHAHISYIYIYTCIRGWDTIVSSFVDLKWHHISYASLKHSDIIVTIFCFPRHAAYSPVTCSHAFTFCLDLSCTRSFLTHEATLLSTLRTYSPNIYTYIYIYTHTHTYIYMHTHFCKCLYI